MATKQEYIDTLACITKEYYSGTVRTPEEVNKFNSYLRLFEGLVDEHFGGKKETNFEHFKNEIKDKQFDFAVIDGKVSPCKGSFCDKCLFNSTESSCNIAKIKWLYKRYKKKYKLTQFEYDLLQSHADGYRFKDISPLTKMKEKGYFKDVNNKDEKIKDIVENCEVIKND